MPALRGISEEKAILDSLRGGGGKKNAKPVAEERWGLKRKF